MGSDASPSAAVEAAAHRNAAKARPSATGFLLLQGGAPLAEHRCDNSRRKVEKMQLLSRIQNTVEGLVVCRRFGGRAARNHTVLVRRAAGFRKDSGVCEPSCLWRADQGR